ncbi:MAG TPA: DinB family protein, partial [Blastocatellia bacterium]|nr:DinB family protein [Blastocatellia bacterium]
SALVFLILLCSLTGAGRASQASSASDPRMTQEERAKVLQWMRDSQKEYLEAIENLTEAQWRFKPGPFRWSVGEVAEHIMLTERALFSVVERALTEEPNPDWEKKTAGKAQFIERVMPSRTGRAQAPIEVRPTGKLSRDEVVKQFKEVRSKVLEFAEKTDKPLKAHTIDHPFQVFNTLNAYDWLIYIPLHTVRHNKQIAEVKASAGYPK